MFYSFDLTIPAGTAAASPVELDVDLVPGVIHRVEIQFPLGCRGLVHIQVWQEFHQVWPTNPGGTLAGNGDLIAWNDNHELVEGQSRLTLRGWSPGTAFEHVITFRFALLAAAAAPPPAPPLPALVPVLGTLEIP